MKNFTFIVFMLFVLSSCATLNDSNKHSNNIYGEFTTTLPCGDCAGIRSTIILNADGTFIQTDTYLKEKEYKFIKRGKLIINKNLITTVSKDGEISKFKLKGSNLLRLNDDGSEVSATFKDYYIYKMMK